jgi:hypothetical protein
MYYLTFDSILNDLKLIMKNANEYNDTKSVIAKESTKLYAKVATVIETVRHKANYIRIEADDSLLELNENNMNNIENLNHLNLKNKSSNKRLKKGIERNDHILLNNINNRSLRNRNKVNYLEDFYTNEIALHEEDNEINYSEKIHIEPKEHIVPETQLKRKRRNINYNIN